ncbi:MAG TPA: hypothetical protein GX699_10090 [Firmicutes bacterium]|nr:hypothetical protein [Bacillota bacterium]
MSTLPEVDVRGLSCPEPVIRVKQAIEANPGGPLTVFSDSFVAAENIRRLAASLGYNCETAENDADFVLTITKKV